MEFFVCEMVTFFTKGNKIQKTHIKCVYFGENK